jgi:hypothetical protein
MWLAVCVLALVFVAQATALPIIRRLNASGLEILNISLGTKLAETFLATISVVLVTTVYTILIKRSSLISTTAMYPRRPIEANIGQLLSQGWPDHGGNSEAVQYKLTGKTLKSWITGSSYSKDSGNNVAGSVQLFYLGKMNADGDHHRVAKGLKECTATAIGKENRPSLWLTSGSPLTKNIVQLLIWEWVSGWLMLLMFFATLLFNGFLTEQLNIDSYPRLAIVIMYVVSYIIHWCYVWVSCSTFFTNVFAGAAWSLLERAKFGIADSKKLYHRMNSELPFELRSIDKASSEFVPTTFSVMFKQEIDSQNTSNAKSLNSEVSGPNADENQEDPKDTRAALATIDGAQKNERNTATNSSTKALDQVIANALILMGITLSSGFTSWTASQFTGNTPNNTSTTQIGSLALLGSLSLGAAAMFSSAMHLSTMESSYSTILSLKEIKINGQAVDHYKKRVSSALYKQLSFTKGTVPIWHVSLIDIFAVNKLSGILGLLVLGPAYALLPTIKDHERSSANIEFDFVVKVRSDVVLLTTRRTDSHALGNDGLNVEAINVCNISSLSNREKENMC